MPKIALEGMQFYAFHGFYPEEQVVGNEYMVDVYLDTVVHQIDPSVKLPEDDINTTISYETIYHICKLELKKPVKLIETLAQRILKKIKAQYKNRDEDLDESLLFYVEVKSVLVRVSKFQPPMGGRMHRAFVEVSG